jgi:hypothetical protein
MSEPTTVQDDRERLRADLRVRASPALRPYADIILEAARGNEADEQWVATAPESEIVAWAEDLRDSERDVVAREETPPETGRAWE